MDLLEIAEDSEVCKRSYELGNFEIEQFRICRFSRLIARLVINQSGGIDLEASKKVIEGFHIKSYGSFDAIYPIHVKKILEIFFQKKFELKLRQLSFPLVNGWVEEIIQGKEKRDISIALVEAMLTFLRQSVGSCFATAPIILTQMNDPEFLFEDLYDLITRGFLKRVIDGVEYKVPISIKTSMNTDFESPLLRCYEYTVASFADWKTEFYKWNVYTGLGLDTKEEEGIGRAVYTFLDEKLQKENKALEKMMEELYHAEDRYNAIERLFKGVSSEDRARRLEAEAKVEAHHFYVMQDLVKVKQAKAEKIAQFYPFFIEQLLKLFPIYFQEVFDPDMRSAENEILEDRPAGFRLLFKHGRSDPTVWTMIYNEKEYLAALEEFFRLSEADIKYAANFEGAKELIQEVVDVVIRTIWEKSFLENVHLRMKEMRKKHLPDTSANEPWAYISGGNLESLASCYFALKNPLIRKDFFPETPMELCASLIDYMKDLPYTESKQYEDDPLKGILMTNQVHAFIFKPGLKPFLEAWQNKGNTYTYIRDYKGVLSFADTNWSSDLFAFVHDPHTNELALCRQGTFDLKSLPSSWNNYFSKKSAWTLWTR